MDSFLFFLMTNFYCSFIYDQGHCRNSMKSATANSHDYLLFSYNYLHGP